MDDKYFDSLYEKYKEVDSEEDEYDDEEEDVN